MTFRYSHLRRLKLLVQSTLMATALTAISISSAIADQVMPLPSDTFRQFVSVQTHLSWPKTLWAGETWRAALGGLQVSMTRSAFTMTALEKTHLDRLYFDYGIRSSATISTVKSDCTFDRVKAAATLAYIRDTIGPEKFYAIEGPNEYNKNCNTGAWATRLRDFQKWLYTTVKADPQLRQLDVLAPSIWNRLLPKYKAVGDISASADYGVLHYYNGASKPTLYLRTGVPTSMDQAIADVQMMVPGKKVAVTETGYYVNEGAPSATRVPQTVAAKYLPRMIGELFLRRDRVSMVNVYSLIDDVGTNRFGLLRGEDLSPRPAYGALQNTLAVLSDRGDPFTPAALDYTLLGSNLTDVHHIMLQKRDGRVMLVIWQDAVSYDTTLKQEVDVPTRAVSLDIPGMDVSQVRFYDPLSGPDYVSAIDNPGTHIDLAVPDRLMIVELVPPVLP